MSGQPTPMPEQIAPGPPRAGNGRPVATLVRVEARVHTVCNRRMMASGIALLLLMGFAAPALAYTQEGNAYPNAPQTCNDSLGQMKYYCVRWPKTSSNLSVTVYVLLDSSLGGEEYDLAADIRNTIVPAWNGIAARNPHLVTCICPNYDILVQKIALPAGRYGESGMPHTTSLPSLFTSGVTNVATGITWNHSLTCAGTNCDDRAVLSHEFGHEEGLGHTGITQSVMGGVHYNPQANDKAGIVSIYGAYP